MEIALHIIDPTCDSLYLKLQELLMVAENDAQRFLFSRQPLWSYLCGDLC